MSSCAELTLGRSSDLANTHYDDAFYVGRCQHRYQHEVSDDAEDQMTGKLDEYVKELEEERKKIEGFKRELPLCMELLTAAIQALKEQLSLNCAQDRKTSNVKETHSSLKHFDILPVLRQLIPDTDKEQDRELELMNRKQKKVEGSPPHADETKNNTAYSCIGDDDSIQELYRAKSIISSDRKGAFLPFNRTTTKLVMASHSSSPSEDGERLASNSEKASSPPSDGTVENPGTKELAGDEDAAKVNPSSNDTSGNAANRKPRRSWSPDLHRKFVDALQKLGGSEVATPKQIRELMKVDGLTNDEVKSHLQKYRLHTRRPNVNYDAAPRGPQLVVLDGIWLPQEYGNAAVLVNQALVQNQSMAPASAASTQYMHFGSGMPNMPKNLGAANSSIRCHDSDLQQDGIDGHIWRYGHTQAGMFRENMSGGHLNHGRYKRMRCSTDNDNSWEDESEAEAGRVYQNTRLDL